MAVCISNLLCFEMSISNLPYFQKDEDGEYFGEIGKDVAQYSLREIAEHYNVKCDKIKKDLLEKSRSQVNDQITTACVQCICDSIKKEWLAKANCEVPELKNLHPMSSSVKQQPDTAVYFKEEVGFSCKTCSSLMLWTERKATIRVADLLRPQHWKGYTDINSITTFISPNLPIRSVLTEITVTWKDFIFLYKLTRHTDMIRGFKEARGSYRISMSFHIRPP